MNTAVVGLQWGDEGKGKITHLLARGAKYVVRFNGGPNAGHTVVDRGVRLATHLLPAGVFFPGCTAVLAGGMVIDFEALREEYDAIRRHLGEPPRLAIAENAHLILPYHRVMEEIEGSGAHFGTTRRGIAPAYRDKAAHVGVRAGDLAAPDGLCGKIAERLESLCRQWPASEALRALSAEKMCAALLEAAEPWRDSIRNVAAELRCAMERGDAVLFEGAQGALLDVDFGTYPYVTSSSTTIGGIAPSIGAAVPAIERRVGVVKAYTSRVGEGPFPTELNDPVGTHLRTVGGEFGTTTGRPRRCGWLDLVALRYAAALNAVNELAITKLDVLSGLEALKVCTEYRVGGRRVESFPLSGETLAVCEPVYEMFQGWPEDLRTLTKQSDLPGAARRYVEALEDSLAAPATILSVGAGPEQTIGTGL
ncbi:MAG: adenylosuccinate synthase [Candidatus Bipolaricaulota bacterium]